MKLPPPKRKRNGDHGFIHHYTKRSRSSTKVTAVQPLNRSRGTLRPEDLTGPPCSNRSRRHASPQHLSTPVRSQRDRRRGGSVVVSSRLQPLSRIDGRGSLAPEKSGGIWLNSICGRATHRKTHSFSHMSRCLRARGSKEFL